MADFEGQTFAGYEILSLLGRGGMGAVYKARQPMLKRLVALKIMAPELAADEDYVARFKREATAGANLTHPNIVRLFAAGEFEGRHYFAMEFVEGETLRARIKRHGKLDAREAIAITVQIAQALQYAWRKTRLVHRDIKPENVFISDAGEVKVGDMGLAKTVGGATTSLTQTGMMMGSPHYISPEQAKGAKDIDFRADIYSLGCTLYHMLTGQTPYEGEDSLVVINKHVHELPPAIFKVWPTCPVALAVLVGKMLAKQRHERPGSYEELIAQLQAVHDKLKPEEGTAPVRAAEPARVATPTPQPAVATPKPARDSRLVIRDSRVVLGAALAVVVVAVAGVLWWSPWKRQREASSGSPVAERATDCWRNTSVLGEPRSISPDAGSP